MSRDLIIELDRDWDLLEASPRPGWILARTARLIGLSLVMALTMSTLGASHPAPQPPITQLGLISMPPATAPDGNQGAMVGGLLLMEAGDQTIAYEPDGRLRWSVRFDGSTQASGYREYRMLDGLLLVLHAAILNAAEGVPVEPTYTSIAVDPVSGAQLWHVDGFVERAGSFLLVGDGRGTQQVFASPPSKPLWRVPAALASAVDLPTGALLTLAEGGTLTEYDLATGAVRTRGQVQIPRAAPAAAPAPGFGRERDELQLEVAHDLVVLRARNFGGETVVTRSRSYTRATLQPASSPLESFDFTIACGPVLCAMKDDQTSVLDPVTFTKLWQAPKSSIPLWTGTAMVIDSEGNGNPEALVDPHTGAHLVTLKGWTLVYRRSGVLVAAELVTKYVGPDRTYVALVRATGLQVLGVLPQQVNNCQFEPDLLVCGTADGRIGVWRVDTR